MRLNGWQRLWVVVVVPWVVCGLLLGYSLWPKANEIEQADVYRRMQPGNATKLVAPPKVGDDVTALMTPRTLSEREFNAIRDQLISQAPSGLSEREFQRWIGPRMASAVTEAENTPPATAEMEGQKLQFVVGVSKQDVARVTAAYGSALHRELWVQRGVMIGKLAAFWVVPPVVLYALGWGIAWVRRGFIEQ